MNEVLKMTLVLTSIALISGATLGFLKNVTEEPIAYQQLKYVKGPAVKQVLQPCDNDPVRDALTDVSFTDSNGQKTSITAFPAQRNGTWAAVAFEVAGKGYGGDLAIMIGVDLQSGELTGMRLIEHSETPGLGARATEKDFYDQFTGLPKQAVALRADGGEVQGISGATVTSRGLIEALQAGLTSFQQHRKAVLDRLNRSDKPSQEATP